MILVLPSYERARKQLTEEQLERVQHTVSRLEASFAAPHSHSGVGIRKFGSFLEARAGLSVRILLVSRGPDLILVTAGDHDQVRTFVKNNPKPKV